LIHFYKRLSSLYIVEYGEQKSKPQPGEDE